MCSSCISRYFSDDQESIYKKIIISDSVTLYWSNIIFLVLQRKLCKYLISRAIQKFCFYENVKIKVENSCSVISSVASSVWQSLQCIWFLESVANTCSVNRDIHHTKKSITRSRNTYLLPKCGKSICQRSYECFLSKYFTYLPNCLKSIIGYNSFKVNIKRWLQLTDGQMQDIWLFHIVI